MLLGNFQKVTMIKIMILEPESLSESAGFRFPVNTTSKKNAKSNTKRQGNDRT